MMLIAPETLRWLRSEVLRRGPAPWSTDAAHTCNVAIDTQAGRLRDHRAGRAGRNLAAEHACVELVDGWQATDTEGSLSPEQLRDLQSRSTGHDWHLVSIALAPIERCWIPNPREVDAADRCRHAWNGRARRLRDTGIDPWPATGTSLLARRPRRLAHIRTLKSRDGSEVTLHARLGAFTHRWLSVVSESTMGGTTSLVEVHSEPELLLELASRDVDSIEAALVVDSLAGDARGLIWGAP